MYDPDRRRGGRRARRAPAEAHEGPAARLLGRHAEESRHAARSGKRRRWLVQRLLGWRPEG